MYKHFSLHCFMIVLSLLHYVLSDFLIPSAIVGLASYVYKSTYCKWKECCTETEIPANFLRLRGLLSERVYGQHLVQETVVSALQAHWDESIPSQKALTLSFHGWPGTGKNYVSRFIQESLYAKGEDSIHVHHFMGRIHFPLKEKALQYQDDIYNWINGNVSKCPKQLFIFDEVDKMPTGVLNIIKPIIDYNIKLNNVDYRRAVFIFLSNTGSRLITENMIKLWKEGVLRQNVRLHHFEKLMSQGAFNEEGGFHHSDTIKSNLIDHYIPFLPLEYEHVRKCILDEFRIRGSTNPDESLIEEVMDFVEWGPTPENLYSKTGCKRLSQKVAMVIHKQQFSNL